VGRSLAFGRLVLGGRMRAYPGVGLWALCRPGVGGCRMAYLGVGLLALCRPGVVGGSRMACLVLGLWVLSLRAFGHPALAGGHILAFRLGRFLAFFLGAACRPVLGGLRLVDGALLVACLYVRGTARLMYLSVYLRFGLLEVLCLGQRQFHVLENLRMLPCAALVAYHRALTAVVACRPRLMGVACGVVVGRLGLTAAMAFRPRLAGVACVLAAGRLGLAAAGAFRPRLQGGACVLAAGHLGLAVAGAACRPRQQGAAYVLAAFRLGLSACLLRPAAVAFRPHPPGAAYALTAGRLGLGAYHPLLPGAALMAFRPALWQAAFRPHLPACALAVCRPGPGLACLPLLPGGA